MGIPFTLPMGFVLTVTMGFLLTIALAIQLTISISSPIFLIRFFKSSPRTYSIVM
jgi:hypothetical protein